MVEAVKSLREEQSPTYTEDDTFPARTARGLLYGPGAVSLMLGAANPIPTAETLEVEFKSDRDCLNDDDLIEALICLANVPKVARSTWC